MGTTTLDTRLDEGEGEHEKKYSGGPSVERGMHYLRGRLRRVRLFSLFVGLRPA